MKNWSTPRRTHPRTTLFTTNPKGMISSGFTGNKMICMYDSLPADMEQYQHEAITSRSRQLLMMGTWLPKTCWATIRREIKNTKVTSSWFFLSIHNSVCLSVCLSRSSLITGTELKSTKIMRMYRIIIEKNLQSGMFSWPFWKKKSICLNVLF